VVARFAREPARTPLPQLEVMPPGEIERISLSMSENSWSQR
jgi:hypothetical protein